MRDHDHEPVAGLPERLPAGEQVLWQGAPDWRILARRMFHIRGVVVYLAAIWVWLAIETISAGPLGWHAAGMVGANLALAGVALGLLTLFCYLIQRTTLYTVTNRRLVIRFGIALPLTVNLPFALIGAAAMKADRAGHGNVTVSLLTAKRLSYLIMWPHVRPWQLRHTQPMLRALPDAVRAGQILSRALAASAEQAAPALPQPRGATATADRAAAAA